MQSTTTVKTSRCTTPIATSSITTWRSRANTFAASPNNHRVHLPVSYPSKPNGTSQNCSSCGVKVPKTLSVRLHECPKCGLSMDRDENAAVNILNRALNEVGLISSARGGFGDTQPLKRENLEGSPHHTLKRWWWVTSLMSVRGASNCPAPLHGCPLRFSPAV